MRGASFLPPQKTTPKLPPNYPHTTPELPPTPNLPSASPDRDTSMADLPS